MMDFVIILVIVAIVSILINAVEDHNKVKNRMSFKESLDLVGLPIVTFKQGEKKFNFLLDTGASESVINGANINDFIHTVSDKNGTTFGIDGNKVPVSYAQLELEFNTNKYSHEYQVVDIQGAIDNLKTDYGVNMVGILGSDFFEKYKYVLDFAEYIAYQK